MVSLDLNGLWKMRKIGDSEWTCGNVPGSVFNDLLNVQKIKDPFYRNNEEAAKIIASYDYEYERDFEVISELIKTDKIILCCEGIDTISTIYINGMTIAETRNMHSTYEFNIKEYLRVGKNNIKVVLHSPLKYIEIKNRENPVWGTGDAIEGFSHIRKEHCSFGWDWGPQIPDSGIWRNIYIKTFNTARLEDVYITQRHYEGKVSLDIRVRIQNWGNKELSKLSLQGIVRAPGDDIISTSITVYPDESYLEMEIENPKLWWPNNFGDHPLYEVEINLQDGEKLLDSKVMNIGLRTLTIRKEKDEYGESFEFVVNGKSIFAMGADYIPEDSLLPRCNIEKTERLIKDCVEANYNCIRVWGGGIYPEDYFFDLCDRYGLIVWQDLMYACAVYVMNKEFTESIKKETIDNVKRIRHHASLGLWCGNNEMELGWVVWDFGKTSKLRIDYVKQFEIILPELVKELDPNTFYWPASPSSGGGFEDPNNENIGDAHYWDVWHGLKPFTEYRKFYFRFVSEFGFQSFPELKTIESFTLPEDRNIFSDVMENHQKNNAANGKILYYLSQNLKYPKDFNSLLYASQILQAKAIKYGVEHWRRNRGRCMGAIYWQINDCWPVASWSSIDYFGRWKALHYYAKRFFSPILLSVCEEGTKVELNVSNETLNIFKGRIIWKLRDNTSTIITQGSREVSLDALSAVNFDILDFDGLLDSRSKKMSTYFEYSLVQDEKLISLDTVLFVPEKHFKFLNPNFEFEVSEKEDKFVITLTSKSFARNVEIRLSDMDCKFSDNYFHVSAHTSRDVEVKKSDLSVIASLQEIINAVKIRSIFDIA